MRELIVLVVASVLVSACGAPRPEVFPSPNASLAARPSVTTRTAATASPTPNPTRSEPAAPHGTKATDEPTPEPAVEDASEPQTLPDTASSPPAPPLDAVFRPVGGINDAQGDIPRGTPAWADIIGLVMEDDGATLRIRIDLAEDLPATLRNRETARIGVDLFRGDDGQPRYRIFVDGNEDGWLAYFQRPDGFVAYPGTATMAGSQLALTVPAAAVGDPVQGDWRAFLEWEDPGGGGREARDAAPDEGWGTFIR